MTDESPNDFLATVALTLLLATPVALADADDPEPAPALPPGMPPGMAKAPPPLPKSGSFENDAQRGTAAPDGIGVAVGRSPTAGAFNTETVTYVPWEDETDIQPLPVGAPLPPEASASTADGSDVDLNLAVTSRPTVLMYYRGGWCPFCNAHLRDLQASVPMLEDMGYQIIAVSTDTVEALQGYEASTEFSYQLLSDANLELATKLGLKFKVVQQYIDHVKELPPERAFDLNERNGGYLVTPAAYILDTNGIVRFVYANNNYTVRVSQEALLQAARDALD